MKLHLPLVASLSLLLASAAMAAPPLPSKKEPAAPTGPAAPVTVTPAPETPVTPGTPGTLPKAAVHSDVQTDVPKDLPPTAELPPADVDIIAPRRLQYQASNTLHLSGDITESDEIGVTASSATVTRSQSDFTKFTVVPSSKTCVVIVSVGKGAAKRTRAITFKV